MQGPIGLSAGDHNLPMSFLIGSDVIDGQSRPFFGALLMKFRFDFIAETFRC